MVGLFCVRTLATASKGMAYWESRKQSVSEDAEQQRIVELKQLLTDCHREAATVQD